MNNFKILSFIQGVDGCGPAFVNKNKEIISKFKDYNDCINFLSMNGLYVNNTTKEDIINKIEDDVKLINKLSVKIITFFDDNYPSKLLDLNNQAPAILYALGNISLLQKSSIGIIGTRNPSEISQKFERQIIEKIPELNEKVIISGLALGCDKIAHETTLKIEKHTIAVLPNGINLVRPPQHKELAKQIVEKNGCLLSVFPIGTQASKTTYVRRNGIVAALSDALLVVECGTNSGTLYTVESSFKMNRTIGCYIPSNKTQGDFSGNEYVVKKYSGYKIDSKEALYSFINKDTKSEKEINTQLSFL